MTQNNSLTFQPGKFYRFRDGRKYKSHEVGITFYSTKEEGMMGVRYEDDGTVSSVSHHLDGSWLKGSKHPFDLIAEWKDAPEVDWSKMPEGTVAVAMDGDGCWFAHQAMPNMDDNDEWNMSEGAIGYSYELYPQHVPKWSGDWRESLVTREESK